MSGHHPHAADLLEAVKLHLTDELLPVLSGYHAYQMRVAVNLLSIVQRQMAQSSDENSARLKELGYADEQQLAAAIRAGKADIGDPALRAYLASSLRDALAVNNPKSRKESA
jgi:hypothetical protein